MSEENVEIVKRGHKAFEKGDLSVMLDVADPEIVTYTAAPLPDAAEYHGREGMLQWIAAWTEGFDDYFQRAEEFIDAGDDVIVGAHQRGIGSQSGVPVEQRIWFFHTVRDGKLVRAGVHATKEQALEAAGLSE